MLAQVNWSDLPKPDRKALDQSTRVFKTPNPIEGYFVYVGSLEDLTPAAWPGFSPAFYQLLETCAQNQVLYIRIFIC